MLRQMRSTKIFLQAALISVGVFSATSCHDLLDERPENTIFEEGTDYTKTSDMILPLIGAYAEFQARGWEDIPLISVRGDDVNAGGKGDQQPYWDTDEYVYAKDYWMYGSVWENFYRDIFTCHVAMEQIEKYKEFAPNPALADQYIAEARTLRAFMLFQLARVWGALLVPESSDPSEIHQSPIATREQVLQHISDEMTAVAPSLPAVRPNERTDIPGGVTRYT